MSESRDRSIHTGTWVVVLVLSLVVLTVGILAVWFKTGGDERSRGTAAVYKIDRQPPLRADEPFPITVYYPSAGRLAAESAHLKRMPESQSQMKEAVTALFADQRSGQSPVLRSLKLNALYLDPAGTAYVDLSASSQGRDLIGSAWDELLAIYAMVNTLTQNFEEVKQAHFLVDGKESQTLAGHMDLSTFFSRRVDLIRQ